MGLRYAQANDQGYTRHKQGKGFTYRDGNGSSVPLDERQRIVSLAIPPAWRNVWIAADPRSHILATGVDERGRKQYMYHPKWREFRGLVKFYRMIMFSSALPAIRKAIAHGLDLPLLSRDKVVAVMLWLLDNTYIRVGNGRISRRECVCRADNAYQPQPHRVGRCHYLVVHWQIRQAAGYSICG